MVLHHRGQPDLLGRWPDDRGICWIVRVRAARYSAYIHRYLHRSPLPSRRRAGRLRELHAHTLAEPAQTRSLPPATGQPPDPARMMAVAAEYGIEILGPP